jgi:penicillin amidase
MRRTALDEDIDSISVGQAFMRAGSGAEFTAAGRGWVAPMQNMVIADVEGRICFVARLGRPLRLGGFHAGRRDAARIRCPACLDRHCQPARRGPDYLYDLTNDWAQPYRRPRIEQVLRSGVKHFIGHLAALQADVNSLAVPLVRPWRQCARSALPLAVAAQRQLVDFDGTMTADKSAPLISWAWLRHLILQVFEDDLMPAPAQRLAGRGFRDALEGVLDRNDTSWCDDKRTPAVENWAMQSDAAFSAAPD